MAEINLLPRRLRTQAAAAHWATAGSILFLLMVVALGALWYITGATLTDVKNNVQTLQQGALIKQDKTAQATGTTTAAQDADTITRVAYINQLSTQEIDWPVALQLVAQLLPTNTTITSYAYATAATGVTLTMAGQDDSIADFAGFIQTLQADKRLSSVVVDSYTFQPKDGSVSFNLTLGLENQAIYYPSIKPK